MADLNLAIIIAAIDKVTGPVKKMTESLGGLQKAALRVAEAGTKVRDFGQNLQASALLVGDRAARMRAGIQDLLAPVEAIENAAAKVRSLPGQTDETTKAFKDRAREWSKIHSDTASSFVDTSYMMLSAGLNNAAALAATQTGLAVAKATMGDAAETASMLATVYNNLGDKTKDVNTEMGRIGDVLTRTQQQFQFANMGQLSEGLKYATPAAISYRMELAQVSTVIGQLNNAGMQGAMAGTAFAATMARMTEASQKLGFEVARNKAGGVDFIGTLENIRAEFGDLTKMSDGQRVAFQKAFGGPEALRSIDLLSANIDALKAGFKSVEDSAGAAAAAQAVMEKAPGERLKILKNRVDNLKAAIGNALLPMIIEKGIPAVTKLLDTLTRFAEAHPRLVQVAGGFFLIATAALTVAAPVMGVAGSIANVVGWGMQVGGLVGTMGKVAGAIKVVRSAFMALSSAFLTNPIGWVCLAIGAAAFIIYKYWKPIGAFFEKLFPGISATVKKWWPVILGVIGTPLLPFIAPLLAIGGLIYQNWGPIKAWFLEMWPKIKAAVEPLLPPLKRLMEVFNPMPLIVWYVGRLKKSFEITFAWIGAHAEEIAAVINYAWAVIKGALKWSPFGLVVRGWGAMFGWIRGHMEEITAVLNASWALAKWLFQWSPLGPVVAAWEPLKGYFSALWEAVTAVFEKARTALAPILDKIGGLVKVALEPLLKLQEALGPLWNQFVQHWSKKGPATALMASLAVSPAIAKPPAPGSPQAIHKTVAAAGRTPGAPGAERPPGGGYGEPEGLPGAWPAMPGGNQISVDQRYTITIQAAPGMDTKALADLVIKELKARQAQADREALHDAL